ncbi:DUF1993 domain-containing protein [Vitiosangium sp. GDMCC 1.1324]|nr:DUF1993 domain-containing protein [Vitiosangium sp. GDMCC 1.1324]
MDTSLLPGTRNAPASSILRHNGVDVGKGDFLGELPFFDVAQEP